MTSYIQSRQKAAQQRYNVLRELQPKKKLPSWDKLSMHEQELERLALQELPTVKREHRKITQKSGGNWSRSELEKQEVVNAYLSGVSQSEISRLYKTNSQATRRLVARRGFPTRPPGRPKT